MSSDEGLEQEFNSLDAQREACEAYIVSQRHAGWVMLPDMYDDGGLSGGCRRANARKYRATVETENNGHTRECMSGGPGFEPRLTESESAPTEA
jgi:hypothetical protein